MYIYTVVYLHAVRATNYFDIYDPVVFPLETPTGKECIFIHVACQPGRAA